jgi:hypothetical protein
VAPFDDEPISVIFDPNGHIVDRHADLVPFGGISRVENALDTYLTQIRTPNRVVVTTIMQPQSPADEVRPFVQGHLHENPAVRHHYLICLDGDNVHNEWIVRFTPKLVWCRSFTDEFRLHLREGCANANSLNIGYCEQRAQESERQGDIGLAKMYTLQEFERANLQVNYLQQRILNI